MNRIDIKGGITVLSLFDGMSCGKIALERAGIKVKKYYASEIDKYAIKVSDDNHSDIIQLGNVEQVRGEKLDKIDLLIGGSPCQSFSMAGKQLNFEDERGKLFFEYVRLLKEVQPTFFLLENVKMKQIYEDVISNYLGVIPIEINSSLVSAQHRKRLYWTNIPNIEKPKDRKIALADVLEKNFDEKLLLSEKAIAYMNRKVKGGRTHWDFKHHSDVRNGKSQCITANTYKGVPYNVLIDGDIKRRFSPIECERLQTVDEDYTNSVSNTQRYKMIGNGWTVDVISHIFSHLTNHQY